MHVGRARTIRRICLSACLLIVAGCAFKNRAAWKPPVVAAPVADQPTWLASRLPFTVQDGWSERLTRAEAYYQRAAELEAADQATCIDYYYQAAVAAWP